MTRSTLHRSAAESVGKTPIHGSENPESAAVLANANLQVTLFQIEAVGESLEGLIEHHGTKTGAPELEQIRLLASTVTRLCHFALCEAGCR